MERASRILVIASIVAAGAAHAWLAGGLLARGPAFAAAVVAAFAGAFVLARRAPGVALAVIALTAAIAPALVAALLDSPDYHTLGVWLAAAAGVTLAQTTWRRWHAPTTWRAAIAGWAVVVAVTWPIVAGREIDFSLVAARTFDTTSAMFQAPPRAAAAAVVLAALGQLVGLLWLDLLWARYGERGRESPRLTRELVLPFIAGTTLSATAAIVQRLLDLSWMNPPLWANLHRAGGLMFDANSLAIAAAMWAPLAIALAWRRAAAPALLLAATALLTAGMWAAASRTAMLAWLLGMIAAGIGALQRSGRWRPRLAAWGALAGALVVIAALAWMPRQFDSGNALMRALDRLPRLEASDIRRFVVEDLWLRFGYGQAAAEMIAAYPLSGVGVGAFHVLAPDHIYRNTGRQFGPDNAQNWWRHQIAELGVIGALPALGLSVLVLSLLWRRGVAGGADVTTLRGALLGVGLASLVGVPTQHPASWLSFATIVFWLKTAIDATPQPGSGALPRTPRWAWAAIVIGVAIVTAGLVISARASLRLPARAAAVGVPFSYGVSAPTGTSPLGETRTVAADAVVVLPVPDRWLQLTLMHPPGAAPLPTVTARVRLDGRALAEATIAPGDRVTYFIAMPAAPWARLELHVAGAGARDRALQIATAWLREPPGDATPESIIR